MSQELERYKTLCVAQEVEIARLKNGFDELKDHIRINMFVEENYDKYNRGNNLALRGVLHEINRIIGE